MPFLWFPKVRKGQKAAIVAECRSTFDGMAQLEAQYACRAWDWIVACRQTNGRGQYGREWWSPLGNLCVSMLLPRLPDGLKDDSVLLPLLFGAEMVRQLRANGYSVALKWPNDIIANIPHKKAAFGKAGGLLLEQKKHSLTLGLGLNFAPAEEFRAINIKENILPPVSLGWPPPKIGNSTNSEPSLLDFWQSCSIALQSAWLRWQDRASLIQEIESVLAFRGEKIELFVPDAGRIKRTVGYLCGLGTCGELIVEGADGLQGHFCGSLRPVS